MTEVERKLARLRAFLGSEPRSAIRLRGVDWFAWATGGGDSSVIFSGDVGVAEILVTRDEALVLTNRIERDRLAEEVVGPEYGFAAFAWEDPAAPEAYVAGRATTVFSDRPARDELPLPAEVVDAKVELGPEELLRYRALGRDAAEAMTEALARARPETTERELAGFGAEALWRRGVHPMLTLVAGDSRVAARRHPVATGAPLGERAMLVFCGRRHGLYANLTRQIYFRPERAEERARADALTEIEAEIFRATRARETLAGVYAAAAAAYRKIGRPDEIHAHHQGGPTGYLSREAFARPGIEWRCRPSAAFAWNPSLPGVKLEDTVFLDPSGAIEPLTVDPTWPTRRVGGIERPLAWVR